MTFLHRGLTIKARISLISVVFVAGLAAIGAAYLVGEQNVAEAFADTKAYAALQVGAGQIAKTAVGLKGVARDVRYRHESAELRKFAGGLAALSGLVETLAAAPRGEAVAEQIEALKAQIGGLAKQSDSVKSLQVPLGDSGAAGLSDRAESSGETLVSMIKRAIAEQDSLDAERLLVGAFAMRRAQAEFARTFDEGLVAQWEALNSDFDSVLKGADMSIVTKHLIASSFKDYTKSFKAVRAAEADFMRAAEKVSAGLDQIAPVLDNLDAKASTEATGAGDRLAASEAMIKKIIAGAMLLALVLGLIAAAFVARTTARPLGLLRDAMLGLAAGELATNVPAFGRADEIGQMTKAVQTFKDAALDRERLEREARDQREAAEAERKSHDADRAGRAQEQQRVVAAIARGHERLAQGDLTFRIDEAFPPAYLKLKDDFNAAIAQIQETMAVIARTTLGIRANAGGVSQASENLSRRTEQQAASLEESAAALSEITSTVKKAADGAALAAQAVGAADDGAKQGAEVMRQAVAAMDAIAGSAVKISQIIGVIDEIAFQTNLLALNAGVEAARAGDTGRGFAVVATEVRALAQRSAAAAKEIKGLISQSASQVNDGVRLVGESGHALEKVMTQVADLNTIIADIAGGARAQAAGLEEVNATINEMDKMTQQNAAMVEETTAASRSLSQETSELSSLVGAFQVGEEEPGAPAPRAARPVRRNDLRAAS